MIRNSEKHVSCLKIDFGDISHRGWLLHTYTYQIQTVVTDFSFSSPLFEGSVILPFPAAFFLFIADLSVSLFVIHLLHPFSLCPHSDYCNIVIDALYYRWKYVENILRALENIYIQYIYDDEG